MIWSSSALLGIKDDERHVIRGRPPLPLKLTRSTSPALLDVVCWSASGESFTSWTGPSLRGRGFPLLLQCNHASFVRS